jgi:hypothetical protein
VQTEMALKHGVDVSRIKRFLEEREGACRLRSLFIVAMAGVALSAENSIGIDAIAAASCQISRCDGATATTSIRSKTRSSLTAFASRLPAIGRARGRLLPLNSPSHNSTFRRSP